MSEAAEHGVESSSSDNARQSLFRRRLFGSGAPLVRPLFMCFGFRSFLFPAQL